MVDVRVMCCFLNYVRVKLKGAKSLPPFTSLIHYFKCMVFVLVLVLLPLDTEVVIRKFPLVVVLAFVVIRIFFVRIDFTTFLNF